MYSLDMVKIAGAQVFLIRIFLEAIAGLEQVHELGRG